MLTSKYPFSLPELSYPYNGLEPYIDTETMQIHHDRHFRTYIDNLNTALEKYPTLKSCSLFELVKYQDKLPVQVCRNAGGVYNHNLFFEKIGPPSDDNIPTGRLLTQIDKTYGSFEDFKKLFSENAKAVFGSGWTYLVRDKGGNLKIINTKNQMTPVQQGYQPIILFDIWEHAYYLKYKNVRADYIENLWNVVRFR